MYAPGGVSRQVRRSTAIGDRLDWAGEKLRAPRFALVPPVPESVHVRRARRDDLDALAELAESTFRAAFGADNDPDEMEAYVREAFVPGRMRAELADDRNVFLLALDAAAVPIGYARLRAGTAEDGVTGPDPVEIERLYVRPDAIGTGVGAALMRALVEEAVAAGCRTLWLGVGAQRGCDPLLRALGICDRGRPRVPVRPRAADRRDHGARVAAPGRSERGMIGAARFHVLAGGRTTYEGGLR